MRFRLRKSNTYIYAQTNKKTWKKQKKQNIKKR